MNYSIHTILMFLCAEFYDDIWLNFCAILAQFLSIGCFALLQMLPVFEDVDIASSLYFAVCISSTTLVLLHQEFPRISILGEIFFHAKLYTDLRVKSIYGDGMVLSTRIPVKPNFDLIHFVDGSHHMRFSYRLPVLVDGSN